MADFYEEMKKVAAELLAPTSQGGLGQGAIVLIRETPGTPDPDKPWIPVEPTKQTETLDGAATGVDSKLVGTEVGSAVIRSSDLKVVVVPPDMGYQAGDILSLDNKPVTIIDVQNIPAIGITSAVKFIVRG